MRQGRCLGYKFKGAFPLKVGQVQGGDVSLASPES